MPGEKYTNKISARFWLTTGETYLGIGRITLLEKIAAKGSISAAAKDMKMSYKKAWKLIDEINQMYQEPLVIKEQGGKLGGRTIITNKGQEAINNFRQLEKKLIKFLKIETNNINL